MAASAAGIVRFLESHDFDSLTAHHADSDGQAQVTFRLNGLTGVHLPWLAAEMDVRGWHVEKVESVGAATITVAEGTDPFVPGPVGEGVA